MKIFLLLSLVILFSFKAGSVELPPAAAAPSGHITGLTANPGDELYGKMASLKIKEIEKLLGRKLKLKEKIAVKLYQWRIKKGWRPGEKAESSNKGKTALILGIVGIATLFIPYVGFAALPCAILAIIFGNQARKENPGDGKAKAAVILGWVTIGLIILAIALVIALFSSNGFWRFG